MFFLLQVQVEATSQEPLTVLQLLMKGGVVIIPILLLFVLSIYLFIERILYIRSVAKIDDRFIEDIIGMLERGELTKAVSKSAQMQNSIGRILHYGLRAIGNNLTEIEKSIESATSIEIAHMEKKLGYLGIIAGVAPMLGFIGTIAGIIQIFYDISLSDNISIGVIASGLYAKMISSGSGLIVGVLAYTFYHILNILIDRFSLSLQERVFLFMNALTKKV